MDRAHTATDRPAWHALAFPVVRSHAVTARCIPGSRLRHSGGGDTTTDAFTAACSEITQRWGHVCGCGPTLRGSRMLGALATGNLHSVPKSTLSRSPSDTAPSRCPAANRPCAQQECTPISPHVPLEKCHSYHSPTPRRTVDPRQHLERWLANLSLTL